MEKGRVSMNFMKQWKRNEFAEIGEVFAIFVKVLDSS